MAVAVRGADGALTGPDELVQTWRRRIEQAKTARKPYERIWLSNLAFAAGQHWLVWDHIAGSMRHLQDVDPRQRSRVLYTADRINEYIQAQLGELNADDDRPELITAQDGDTAEEVAKEINQAIAYGWDHEWKAADALMRARRFCLTMGVSALRMRFDPTKGPVVDHQPVGQDGQPITDGDEILSLATTGQLTNGGLPGFKPIHEGRSIIEPFTAFQIGTPPGVVHEDDFPWEYIVRPVHVDAVYEQYGVRIQEDTDIASASGLALGQNPSGQRAANDARLRDHVWLYTCYERPCRDYPEGRVVVLGSNQFTLLSVEEKLPYTSPDGSRKSGIVYLHWWRLDDRFWSRAFIEPLKDPQRALNETKTIKREILVRGLPKVFVTKGTLVENPTGVPMEKIELEQNAQPPVFHAGIGPGPWWDQDVVEAESDLTHASTLSLLALGENPPNVNTYSQLALLNENEQTKRSPIKSDHARQKARLVEFGVHDIREWWPDERQIFVSGDEGSISRATFAKSIIPDFFLVKVPDDAPPRSLGAELKKIEAIWAAAQQSGLILTDPPGWTRWYADSIKGGQALELPEPQKDSQEQYAAFENFLMLHGEQPQVAPHDLAPVHAPQHHEALDQARAANDIATAQRIAQHLEDHTQMAIKTRKAWRWYDPTDSNDLASDVALDEDQALRENDMIVEGLPLNPEAFQQALVSLQQKINPETGEPIKPTDDVHAILERASLKPTYVENFQMHLDRHGKVIKSVEFQQFPPDVRGRFLTHFDLTREMWLSLPTMPDKVAAPKVSLQLRESVGPTTIAQTLRRAGIPEADPQIVASEEPMENMVQRNDGTAGQPGASKPAPGQTKKPAAKPKPKPKPKK